MRPSPEKLALDWRESSAQREREAAMREKALLWVGRGPTPLVVPRWRRPDFQIGFLLGVALVLGLSSAWSFAHG